MDDAAPGVPAAPMPFESSLPLVAAGTACVCVALVGWLGSRAPGWLVAAGLAALVAVAAAAADWLVETDRERITTLFHRVAVAAERQDAATIMAVLDPDLRPLRAETERVLAQVRPTGVVITKLEVVTDRRRTPPEAIADMIVRVTGNVIDKTTPGTVLVGVKARLHEKNGRWLVRDAEAEQARPGAAAGH